MVLDLSSLGQMPLRSPVEALAVPGEIGNAVDFASVLASRPSLGMRDGAASIATLPTALSSRNEVEAPVAIRFDEGSLFGHALGLGNPPKSGPSGESAFVGPDAMPIAVHGTGSSACDALQDSAPASGETSSLASPATLARWGPGEETGVEGAARFGPPAPGSASFGGIGSTVPKHGLGYVETGRADMSEPGGQALPASRIARHESRADIVSANDRHGSASRSSRSRAEYVDRLGPVHIVIRETPGAIELTARVAVIASAVADTLVRRLREAVEEEGRTLSRLRINALDYLFDGETNLG